MTYFESIILGLVQGLGEFLPISSSAHLIILPWAFQFPDPGLTFDVALHFGTLFALIVYFWRDWINILWGFMRSSFRPFTSREESKRLSDKRNQRLFWYLVIATIPGAVAGYFLDELAETTLRHPLLVAFNMTLLGILLFIADWKCRHRKDLKSIGLWDCLIIGISQSLALVPGVSRSGITITAGLLRGLNRETAARFSFLMAAPITLGACILKADYFFREGISLQAIVGIAVSALIGFLSIKYLLKFVQNYSYRVFVYYRFAFTVVVVGYYFVR